MEEDDGAASGRSSPPTPKKIIMESEETKELLKVEDHSEDESEEIEDDDEEEGGDGDGSPQSPPLLDMIDLPLSSPLPPTPPLPSSPRDLNMEQEDSEDEGPPPGWDNQYQLKEQVEQMLTPAALSAISSDIKMEDVQQDAWNGDADADADAQELVASDKKVEEQESEDEGPPPGWDSKCQPEAELHVACPKITQSDIKTEGVQQDAWNGVSVTNPVPSDIKMEEQESEDEGPPPGWDSKCQPEPQLQTPCPTITQSDMKVEEQEDEDEGPPPGWDSKLESTITESDIKTDDTQQDAPNTDDHLPTPQVLPSDIKVEEHESEDEGPPPGWDSKFQPQPDLQIPNPTTPPSESKIEDNKGPPPGWVSTTPQQQSQDHHPLGAKVECEEQKNIEAVIERPPKQQSISPIKPQIPVQKPPLTTNNPEMGQMVCGSCRRLLSYPKGARFVECGCCLEENYLLQEHEVGQVICGGCDVLLMYPFGAPKVRCVNCSTETEIGDQNRRPPLSEQQRRGRRHLKRVQTGKC